MRNKHKNKEFKKEAYIHGFKENVFINNQNDGQITYSQRVNNHFNHLYTDIIDERNKEINVMSKH